MTHDPSHTLFFGAGILYFALAGYFSLRNYQMTKQEGFWFFIMLFSLSMTGVMIAGVLWSSGLVNGETIHPYHDILFLISSIMLLDATYTLHKKHHDVKIF
jgi:hypothetical protein